MLPDTLQSFLALAIGYAFAGAVCNGYQLLAKRPASFRLLSQEQRKAAVAAVPMLVFAAPFIIMRNTVRSNTADRQFEFVMLATVVAGVWSLMSGTVVMLVFEAVAFHLA